MERRLKKGDRVMSLDEEDDGAKGTVIDTTLSGGVKVRWDVGRETWGTSRGLEVVVHD